MSWKMPCCNLQVGGWQWYVKGMYGFESVGTGYRVSGKKRCKPAWRQTARSMLANWLFRLAQRLKPINRELLLHNPHSRENISCLPVQPENEGDRLTALKRY